MHNSEAERLFPLPPNMDIDESWALLNPAAQFYGFSLSGNRVVVQLIQTAPLP
jgi:hypothetical protein